MSLSATGISIRFGGLVALNGVDVSVSPGEIVRTCMIAARGRTTWRIEPASASHGTPPYSARPGRVRSPAYQTSSPGLNMVTSGPTACTTPAVTAPRAAARAGK